MGGDIQAQAEQLSITKFKTTGGRHRGQSKYAGKPLAITNGSAGSSATSSPQARASTLRSMASCLAQHLRPARLRSRSTEKKARPTHLHLTRLAPRVQVLW